MRRRDFLTDTAALGIAMAASRVPNAFAQEPKSADLASAPLASNAGSNRRAWSTLTLGGKIRESAMGRFAIVAYTPKAGKEQQLLAAVRKHFHVLQTEQFVTDKPAYVMRAGDGTIVEVFEWRSAEAVQKAHGNPAVQALWGEFGAACDYTPLAKLAETHQMFAEFDAVQL